MYNAILCTVNSKFSVLKMKRKAYHTNFGQKVLVEMFY